MFEKLREYSIYIILGVISIGVLITLYVNVVNSNKGLSFQENVTLKMLEGIKIKDIHKGTTVTHLLNNKGTKARFGDYDVKNDTTYLINQSGLVVTDEGKLHRLLNNEEIKKLNKGVGEKELLMFLLPKTMNNFNDNKNVTGISVLKKNGIKRYTQEGETLVLSGGYEDFLTLSDNTKGFIGDGYFGLGMFNTEKEAKSFRNKYFSKGYVVLMSKSGKYGVFFDVKGVDSSGGQVTLEQSKCEVINNDGGYTIPIVSVDELGADNIHEVSGKNITIEGKTYSYIILSDDNDNNMFVVFGDDEKMYQLIREGNDLIMHQLNEDGTGGIGFENKGETIECVTVTTKAGEEGTKIDEPVGPPKKGGKGQSSEGDFWTKSCSNEIDDNSVRDDDTSEDGSATPGSKDSGRPQQDPISTKSGGKNGKGSGSINTSEGSGGANGGSTSSDNPLGLGGIDDLDEFDGLDSDIPGSSRPFDPDADLCEEDGFGGSSSNPDNNTPGNNPGGKNDTDGGNSTIVIKGWFSSNSSGMPNHNTPIEEHINGNPSSQPNHDTPQTGKNIPTIDDLDDLA